MALIGPTRQQVLQLMMTMFRVETCTDPCGLNWSDEAASPAADDDYVLLHITRKSVNCFYSANIISNVRSCSEGLQKMFRRDKNHCSWLSRQAVFHIKTLPS